MRSRIYIAAKPLEQFFVRLIFNSFLNRKNLMPQMFLPPPDRYSFERELSDVFDRSDGETLARYLKKSAAYVSRCLSPDCEVESIQYRQAWWQFAADSISIEKGDRLFALTARDYFARRAEPNEIIKAGDATSDIGIQFAEFLKAELDAQPIDAQLRELDDIERAVSRKKNCLLAQKLIGRDCPR